MTSGVINFEFSRAFSGDGDRINFEFCRAFSGDGDLGGGCLSSSSVSVSSTVDPAIINVDCGGDLIRGEKK